MTVEPIKGPLTLDERQLDKWFVTDAQGARVADDVLESMVTAMATARGHADQLTALSRALDADSSRSPEGRALELRQSALRVGERGAKALDTARARAAAKIKQIQAETAAPPPPKDAPVALLEGEIRARLASMTHDQRAEVVATAFEDGDDLVLGALLRGPAMLTGMTHAAREMHREHWRRERFPAESDRIARLEKALWVLDMGGEDFLGFVKRLSDAPAALRAEQAAEATAQALAAVA